MKTSLAVPPSHSTQTAHTRRARWRPAGGLVDQTATSSVSPVRMRIAPLSSETKILPSPT